jgi:ABC-2 type transport system permease protein
MRRFLSLWRKEAASHFLFPGSYLVLAVVLMVAGLNFWRLAAQNLQNPVPLSMMLFGPVFFWFMVLALITAVTMRLLAEEKRSGTIETLATAPLRDGEIVLAKFAGAMSFFLAAVVSSGFLILALKLLAPEIGPVDWGPIAGGYLILILCGGFYISVGLLVSASTRSQFLAAVVCFAVLCVLFFAEYFNYVLPGGALKEAIRYVSSSQHIIDFAGGAVDSRPVVWYLTGTAFMLFVTSRVVEAERWR